MPKGRSAMGRSAMNTKRAMKWSLLVAAAGCVAVASMPGCELLVTFDRSKIPSEGGLTDGTTYDGEVISDSSSPNETGTQTPEGSADAPGTDATGDVATSDASAEASPETGTPDSAVDTGKADVAAEATAGGTDSGPEAATDAGSGSDGASEAAVDSGGSASGDDGGNG
jgi:hypothetical protein